MSSQDKEATHVSRIQEILAESGIECTQTVESTISDYGFEEFHSMGECLLVIEEYPEEQVAEELPQRLEEEEQVYVFPTPSLRKVLPDHIREAEKINRIHVLPEEFITTIDPALIPKIASTPRKDYIDILAGLVGCQEYANSLAEFWFLDTMADLLRRAQQDGFDRGSQATLMVWWCETMKEVEHFDAADRERFLRRVRDNMMAAAGHVAVEMLLPAPADIGVDYRPPPPPFPELPEELHPAATAAVDAATAPPSEKRQHSFDDSAYRCGMARLASILHYICDVFSTDYEFELIQSIFTFTPEYQLIDAAHTLHTPKSLFSLAKAKPGKKEAKKKPPKPDKAKSKIPDTVEYLRLMEIKQKEELELEIIQQLEMEEWDKKTHILPLSLSIDIDADFFERYWPPEPEGQDIKK